MIMGRFVIASAVLTVFMSLSVLASSSARVVSCMEDSLSCSMQSREAGPYDRTLRVDYIFSGTDSTAVIALDGMSSCDGWYGRRVNMDSVPVAGNGQISMTDASTGKVLYRNSFSTLFQEWQTTEEATKVCRSFENVYLLPMPDAPADVTVNLFNVKGEVSASFTHRVDPSDILIRYYGSGEDTAPYRYLLKSGSPEECIDIVIVAEGYTAPEEGLFYSDAAAAVEALLSHEPFGKYRDRFNIAAVALHSDDSGVSVPLEGKWRHTPLHSHFSTFYMDRYLTTLNIKDLHDALRGIPYEHIIILANTEVYGGGGIYNSYTLTTAHHRQFRPVVVHEFGHSFGALADEYFYDDMYVEYYYPDVEPWEQNITTLHDFSSKWEDMLPEDAFTADSKTGERIPCVTPASPENTGGIGVYEGAGYQSKGVYRGFQRCRMFDNASPAFCPVCRRAIERMIVFNTEECPDEG